MSQWQLHDAGNNTTYFGLFPRSQIVCYVLNKTGFYRQAVINAPSVKSHKNAPSENHTVTCGQTDRHGEANRRLAPVCERAVNHVLTLSVCSPFLYFVCLALLHLLSFSHILPYLFPHYLRSALTSLFYTIYLFLIFFFLNLTLPNGTGGSLPTGEAVYIHLRLVPNVKRVWSYSSATNPNSLMDCTLIFTFSLSLPYTFLNPLFLPPCCSFLLSLCFSLVYTMRNCPEEASCTATDNHVYRLSN